jgi:formamidopyrimidine-DNA glycosylase
MPELPDLEVFSKNLSAALKGASLQKLRLGAGAKTTVPAKRFLTLEKQRVKKIYREGKELRIAFTKNVLGIHLMLHGRLSWVTEKPPAHTLLTLEFSNGKILALADYQRQARISLDPEESTVPDALSPDLKIGFWKEALQTRATIKNVLLDQKTVRGIGNAYADEILWAARISPFSAAKNLPPAAVRALSSAVKKILKKSITRISKTEPGIIGGELRDFLSVHQPRKKETPTGATIKQKTAAGRRTYYTDEQELYT